MTKIRYENTYGEEWEIYYNGFLAGVLRFYELPDFKYKDKQLTRFLGYIEVRPEFRRKGILRDVVDKFNVKSLMVDDVEKIDIETLKKIYRQLGFKLIDGSERFMIRN